MNVGGRIKEIRKACGATQQTFADKIGLKRNTIANYEIGNAIPSDRTITDICREFDVNEDWLRNGNEPMFIEKTKDEELAAFFGDLLSDKPDFRHRLIAVLARLAPKEWALLEKMADQLLEETKKAAP